MKACLRILMIHPYEDYYNYDDYEYEDEDY